MISGPELSLEEELVIDDGVGGVRDLRSLSSDTGKRNVEE
jgi:hypothetical protein